jgi:hypothetical protein
VVEKVGKVEMVEEVLMEEEEEQMAKKGVVEMVGRNTAP